MNIEVRIEKAAFGGDGIAHVDGKVCLVEGALPGEVVIAKVTQNKKNLLRARVVKLLESSPFRVVPPCPYVEQCGGCQYQHVTYEEELRVKEAQVSEILERAGVEPSVLAPIVRSNSEYGTRNSVSLHLDEKSKSKTPIFGFIGRDNTSIIPIKDCLLADRRLLPVFGVPFRPRNKEDRVTFRLSEKGEIFSDDDERFYKIRIGAESLLAHSQGFFQNNLEMTALLVERVADWVRSEEPELLYDLYAGVGTFTFLSAKNVPQIICVEESRASIEALRMNVSEKGAKNVSVIHGKSEKVFCADFSIRPPAKTMVILDPPRQGLDLQLARFLSMARGVSSFVYVSCDPSTFARDLKILLAEGIFRLEDAVPFDMFPRTKHVEIAAFFKSN